MSVAHHFLHLGLDVGLCELRGGILLEDSGDGYIFGQRDLARIIGVVVAPFLERVAGIRCSGEGKHCAIIEGGRCGVFAIHCHLDATILCLADSYRVLVDSKLGSEGGVACEGEGVGSILCPV